MSRYIGLTIGPIYKSLENAKKTRELWAGSYIFSYIMKEIIKEFKDRKFIIPYVNEQDSGFTNLIHGEMRVGIFHDRLIFEARDNDFKELSDKIKDIIEKISKQVAILLGAKADVVTKYFSPYFQIYFCQKEFDSGEAYNTINKEMNKHLDILELQSSLPPPSKTNFVQEFLTKVNKTFLVKAAFGSNGYRFRSIPEIAVSPLDLKEKNEGAYKKIFETYDESGERDQADIYEEISKSFGGINLKQYHKYIAIVHADGDNMGETIENLKDDDQFNQFSKTLFDFDLKANEIIDDFQGETIFAGGDDLLFFAPVVDKGKSIFELIDSLSNEFKEVFEQSFKNAQIPIPTLSFGVSISYYKFPLYEALAASRDLLYKAKDKNIMSKKNAVAFRVLKHSGQYFEGIFNKSSDEYGNFKKMISAGTDERFLTSVIHNLFSQRAILASIGSEEARLENFFDNTFNEAVHKLPHNVEQLQRIREFVHTIFNSNYYQDEETKLRTIHSALRFNKFMRE